MNPFARLLASLLVFGTSAVGAADRNPQTYFGGPLVVKEAVKEAPPSAAPAPAPAPAPAATPAPAALKSPEPASKPIPATAERSAFHAPRTGVQYREVIKVVVPPAPKPPVAVPPVEKVQRIVRLEDVASAGKPTEVRTVHATPEGTVRAEPVKVVQPAPELKRATQEAAETKSRVTPKPEVKPAVATPRKEPRVEIKQARTKAATPTPVKQAQRNQPEPAQIKRAAPTPRKTIKTETKLARAKPVATTPVKQAQHRAVEPAPIKQAAAKPRQASKPELKMARAEPPVRHQPKRAQPRAPEPVRVTQAATRPKTSKPEPAPARAEVAEKKSPLKNVRPTTPAAPPKIILASAKPAVATVPQVAEARIEAPVTYKPMPDQFPIEPDSRTEAPQRSIEARPLNNRVDERRRYSDGPEEDFRRDAETSRRDEYERPYRRESSARANDERRWSEPRRLNDRDMDAWREGRWMRASRNGRQGWWWVVGSNWYLYPGPVYPYPKPYAPSRVEVEQAAVRSARAW